MVIYLPADLFSTWMLKVHVIHNATSLEKINDGNNFCNLETKVYTGVHRRGKK
jgi:hypothetical protein